MFCDPHPVLYRGPWSSVVFASVKREMFRDPAAASRLLDDVLAIATNRYAVGILVPMKPPTCDMCFIYENLSVLGDQPGVRSLRTPNLASAIDVLVERHPLLDHLAVIGSQPLLAGHVVCEVIAYAAQSLSLPASEPPPVRHMGRCSAQETLHCIAVPGEWTGHHPEEQQRQHGIAHPPTVEVHRDMLRTQFARHATPPTSRDVHRVIFGQGGVVAAAEDAAVVAMGEAVVALCAVDRVLRPRRNGRGGRDAARSTAPLADVEACGGDDIFGGLVASCAQCVVAPTTLQPGDVDALVRLCCDGLRMGLYTLRVCRLMKKGKSLVTRKV